MAALQRALMQVGLAEVHVVVRAEVHVVVHAVVHAAVHTAAADAVLAVRLWVFASRAGDNIMSTITRWHFGTRD